jgi:hypothetical protein
MKLKVILITRELSKLKVTEFWNAIPCYKKQSSPTWRNGWFDEFKTWHQLKQYWQYNEAASANIGTATKAMIYTIRQATKEYEPADIYNMNEMSLSWKIILDRSLGSQSQSGLKQNNKAVSKNL